MKNKILMGLMVMGLMGLMAWAQIVPVNTTTNQTVGGVNITGDTLLAGATKINSDLYFLGSLSSNTIAALNTVSNSVTAQGSEIGELGVTASAFNLFLLTNTVTTDFYNFLATNTVTAGFYNFMSTYVPGIASGAAMNFDGGDITSSAGTITALGFSGSLLDDTGSSGLATYVPTANGDGTWTWAAGGGGGGGSGNVVYGGQMMFDLYSGTTNIESDGVGDAYFGGEMVMGAAEFVPGNYPVAPFTLIDNADDVALQMAYNGNDGWAIQTADAAWTVNTTFYFTASQFEAYSYSAPMYLGGPSFGFNNYAPVETVDISGNFGSDWEQVYSDGSGNLYANTFNPTSDRNRKEHIAPLAPTNALAMALAITNYTWRFKAHTNWVVSKIPTSLGTNLVTFLRTNKLGKIVMRTNSVVVTNSFVLATNAGKVFPASGTEFGPMAQDWHATTGLGGGTNISVTSMNGLLLGAVQGLAAQTPHGLTTNITGTFNGGTHTACFTNGMLMGFQ